MVAKLECKMITRILARPLTVSDNPNCVRLNPNFSKAIVMIFFEYDWNTVAIWALAQITVSKTKVGSYDFSFTEIGEVS